MDHPVCSSFLAWTLVKVATYSTENFTLQDKINNLNSNHEKSVPMRVEFVRLKSYENTESAGEVQIVGVSSEELVNLKVYIFISYSLFCKLFHQFIN